MTIEEARQHIGDGVVYRPYPGAEVEDGTITSTGEILVFVRYAGDQHSKATHPRDLEFLATPSTGGE